WLSKSTWGKESAHWSVGQELTELERLLHRPNIRLMPVPANKLSYQAYRPTMQWQLELVLPSYMQGQTIGLQITRLPPQEGYSYRTQSANPLVLIDEQQGKWSIEDEQPVYRITLGGSDKDTVGVC
nr:hypothetical protein [Vibrio anguillarum]